MNLALRNAHYTAVEAARTKSRDLYGGTAVVKVKGSEYLFREKNEDDQNFALRLKRAVLDNYVQKIIQARQSVLFMRAQTRELDNSLNVFVDDVDSNETSAATFFRDVAQDAQVDGLRWVLVDMPRVTEPVTTAADEKALKVRPFFQSVPACNVVDWAVGEDGRLDWVVIEQHAIQPRLPGEAVSCVREYKVWFRDKWELHRADNANSQTPKYDIVASGDNPLKEVPLVPFYGIKHTDFCGLPVCFSVLDHVILIYNKESDLDWFQRLSCHPIPCVISPAKPEKIDATGGLWIKSGPDSGVIQVNYLQTTGAGESTIRDSIDRIESRIYAIALAQAKRDGKQVQAADSQREDRHVFTSSLKSVSEQLEDSEASCWALMGKWLGIANAKAEIGYSRDFDDRTIDDAMLTALSAMVDERKLSLGTFLSTLQYADILPNFDAEKEQTLLADEAKTRAVALVGDLNKANSGA